MKNLSYSFKFRVINHRSAEALEIQLFLQTARGLFLALMDFLTIFPEYVNRPFYITGEGYGGVYISTLTAYTIDMIRVSVFLFSDIKKINK